MEHAPRNAMLDPGEIERFRDRCSDFMAALLDELATTPDTRRPYRLHGDRESQSGRWEIWADAGQAAALRCGRGAGTCRFRRARADVRGGVNRSARQASADTSRSSAASAFAVPRSRADVVRRSLIQPSAVRSAAGST